MRIVLLGFMGSGKTTVAKFLADKLNMKAIEMDDLTLKKSSRKSINEIFASDGEKKFRELELQVAKELSKKDDVVISAGGGVVMNALIMNYLKKNSQVIYLKSSFEKAAERINLKKIKPPLFQNIYSARKLFKLREPIYAVYANITIITDEKSLNEVIEDIIVELKQR